MLIFCRTVAGIISSSNTFNTIICWIWECHKNCLRKVCGRYSLVEPLQYSGAGTAITCQRRRNLPICIHTACTHRCSMMMMGRGEPEPPHNYTYTTTDRYGQTVSPTHTVTCHFHQAFTMLQPKWPSLKKGCMGISWLRYGEHARGLLWHIQFFLLIL